MMSCQDLGSSHTETEINMKVSGSIPNPMARGNTHLMMAMFVFAINFVLLGAATCAVNFINLCSNVILLMFRSSITVQN